MLNDIIKNLSTLRGSLAAARSEHYLGNPEGTAAALERAKMVCTDEQRGAVEAAELLLQAGNTDAAIAVVELLQLNAQQAEQINSMRRVAAEIDDLRDGLHKAVALFVEH